LPKKSNAQRAAWSDWGFAPGDRVGVWATNCAEWIYLQLGCARAGLVQVNVNPAYRAHELAYVLRKSEMKALVLRAADYALELQAGSRRSRRQRAGRRIEVT
jgi:fatty-acyl-CoA synthase